MIRATLVYIFVGLYILAVSPLALAWLYFSKDTHFAYDLARFCIRSAGWMCNLKVVIRGREKLLPGQTYLFVSNHQGNFDGPLLVHAIPRDLRALIKKEMMKIPVLSMVLRQTNFVPVDRRDPQQARAAIDCGARLLKQGCSFFAFPEGTRSRNGRLGEFKRGVFVMALKAAVPIVPVSIINSNRIQPPGTYAIRAGFVTMIFHDPIPTVAMAMEDRHNLVEMTRAAIASGLEEELRDRSSEN